MAEQVYKKVEITGTSSQGYEAAIKSAVAYARKKHKDLSWFEVVEQRGNVKGADIIFQVTLKIGFLAPAD